MPTLAPFRACSTLIVKSVDDAARVIEGVASSSAPDLAGDEIMPRGAIFELPMPLLMQHDRNRPVGNVTAAKVSDTEIEIRAELARDTGLPYVEDAWRQLKAGLVRGLSIGANPLKAEPILDKDGRMTGIRYTAWRWLELSAVTLPMNTDASLDVVRAFDPWGATAYARRHDPAADTDPAPGELTYRTVRAAALEALNLSARALYRG
jgi:uncharacterized protein